MSTKRAVYRTWLMEEDEFVTLLFDSNFWSDCVIQESSEKRPLILRVGLQILQYVREFAYEIFQDSFPENLILINLKNVLLGYLFGLRILISLVGSSGKLSRKSDINEFEKLFAWLLVWLTHINIFGM
ncbi:hypothetical protein HID58_080554, partial [Brassica napus]